MAFKIVWSLQSREDLRDIVRFVARDNPAAAEALGYSLISRVDSFQEFPRPGRVVPQVADFQRSGAIARVWHGSRGAPVIVETPLL